MSSSKKIITLFFIILIVFVIYWGYKLWNTQSSQLKTSSTRFDDNHYPIRELYKKQFPLRVFTDDQGQVLTPTGRGQTVAIVANCISVYYISDILQSLADNHIYNKSVQDLQNQIRFINASLIDGPFKYMDYENLTIPLSDGIYSRVRFNDARESSLELSMQLQVLFSSVPDVNVIIFYYGANPEECPPDSDNMPIDDEIYEQIINKLVQKLSEQSSAFHVFCCTYLFDHLINSSISFYTLIGTLTSKNITCITTCGNKMDLLTSYPSGFRNVITTGGLAKLANGTVEVYAESHGGAFTSNPFPNYKIPDYQIGNVPQDLSNDSSFVGVPDLSGNVRNLRFYYNQNPMPVRLETNTISTVATSASIIMVNEISNHLKCNYQSILYRYPHYLFDSVNKGRNSKDYQLWNPLAGFGELKGECLSKLLLNKYVMTGIPLQISSNIVSEKMSYLNFYPISPLKDPLNTIFSNDTLTSIPTLGPQTIWSCLYFYKVNMNDPSNISLDYTPHHQIYDGDVFVILNARTQHNPTWALKLSPDHFVMVLEKIEDLSLWHIDESFLWTALFSRDDGQDYPLSLFQDCRIVSYQSQGSIPLRLSASYDQNIGCPSLTTGLDNTTFFKICPHYYQFLEFEALEKSYFVNIASNTEFISCEYNAITALDIGRPNTSRLETIPHVNFERDFNAYSATPQWMLIPIRPAKDKMNSLLRLNDMYMIFNSRLQAYLYFDRNESTNPNKLLRLLNINHQTCPLSSDIYNDCIFNIEHGGTDEKIFVNTNLPVGENNLPQPMNNFIRQVKISYEYPFYTSTSPKYQEKLYLSTQPFVENGKNVCQLVPECPTTHNINLFAIHNDYLVNSYDDLILSVPPLNVIANNSPNPSRFINHAISADNSNDYVRMVHLNDNGFRSKMKWTVRSNGLTIEDSDLPFRHIVLNFNNTTSIILENTIYPRQYLINCEGGWKPRLGYECDGMTWNFSPNYMNVPPSKRNNPDTIQLTGNYFYKNTLYFIDCPRGTMSCSLNAPHLPALLTEINNENVDTTYYSSQFFVSTV